MIAERPFVRVPELDGVDTAAIDYYLLYKDDGWHTFPEGHKLLMKVDHPEAIRVARMIADGWMEPVDPVRAFCFPAGCRLAPHVDTTRASMLMLPISANCYYSPTVYHTDPPMDLDWAKGPHLMDLKVTHSMWNTALTPRFSLVVPFRAPYDEVLKAYQEGRLFR